MDEFRASPRCREEPDWPNSVEASRRLFQLVEGSDTPDFDLIEKAQNEVGFSRDRFPTGEFFADKWFDMLNQAALLDMLRGKTIIRDWLAAKGRDSYAPVAEALFHYRLGWRARGSGYASTVSPEGWKIFHEELEKAKKALDATTPRIQASGPWHATNLLLAFRGQRSQAERLKAFQDAVAAWPLYGRMYVTPMIHSQPKWGGSFELMDSIARYAVEKTRSDRGNAFYAILYELVFRDQGVALKDTLADWNLVKQGIKDLEDRGGGQPWLWRSFAMMACQVRDRPETARLLKVYDEKKGAAPAGVASGEPACRLFAGATD